VYLCLLYVFAMRESVVSCFFLAFEHGLLILGACFFTCHMLSAKQTIIMLNFEAS
jgi:hypothetical protein